MPESGREKYVINNAHSLGVTAIAATNDCKRILSGGGEGQVISCFENPEQLCASSQDLGIVWNCSVRKGAILNSHLSRGPSLKVFAFDMCKSLVLRGFHMKQCPDFFWRVSLEKSF